jgi:hypothetical protein
MADITPEAHPDPWLNLLQAYVSEATEALRDGGLKVQRAWLDPSDPRDATILYAVAATDPRALVWDEEQGWREGKYVSGEQGVRTVLDGARHVGGQLLPSARRLAHDVHGGITTAPVRFRSYQDVRDGLDDALVSGGHRA